MLGKLARNSDPPKGLETVVCIPGEAWEKVIEPYPGRSDGQPTSEVSIGYSSRWGNDHPGQAGKPDYRAKGRTVKKLSRKEQAHR